MRTIGAIIVATFTFVLIYLLDKPLGALPALGPLLDPVSGCLANAEPVSRDFSRVFTIPSLQGNVSVSFDDRLVPHVQAANERDLYFIQGYIHAYFRLWQMDMETRAAAGRISEVVGEKALNFDRLQRRKGMVYAAENSLRAAEAEPHTKMMLDAYTAGINHFISSLCFRELPLEYKLIGFSPEPWNNIKSTLLLKYMADDLTGYTEDIPLTVLRDMLPEKDFNLLFPEKTSGSSTVIPKGTLFDKPSVPTPAIPNDSVWAHFKSSDFSLPRPEGTGSNNWAISGARTRSGATILCNDPHLGLNLPSLWYEMQLQSPGINVYGVSLPGAPGIVIGFNDSISWGFTNNYRDVKDFYLVKPVHGDKHAYWLADKQLRFTDRAERIKIKNKADFIDTVSYTIQGPVIYNETFHGPGELNAALAMCWMAHKPTNELLALYYLNRAENYSEFTAAIMHFQCPAQNMAYADRAGNIAMWTQGQFVNKWKEQGRFVMNGADSAALWKEYIPMRENPHVFNPAQGYLCSANQAIADSSYPYWYNGYFYEFRAWRINHVLSALHGATVQDMFALQNDTYSELAANTLPVMLQYLSQSGLTGDEKKYFEDLKKWNYSLTAESIAATVYQIWWQKLYEDIWQDDFIGIPGKLWPSPERTMQLVNADTTLKFFNNGNTAAIEKLRDMVSLSYIEAIDSVNKLEKANKLEWYKAKNTTITHLAKLLPFSYPGIKIGGWGNTVNAAKGDHGPSWRMVVQMGKEIEAYGVYPGGQSGNPGSKYYADFIPKWAEGKYNRLLFFSNNSSENNKDIKYKWAISTR